MQFGICIPHYPYGVMPTPDTILKAATLADRLGYDSVWVSDHILVPRDKPRYGTIFEALATLAYVGARTERVRLGTSVLVAPQRDAVLIAKQAATIDALTGGRMILGVGAGWMEGEFNSLGADFKRRGRHLDEAIRVMRALWTEDNPRIDGQFYRFSDVIFGPKPAQVNGIPIWIGGASDAALRRTAEIGDGWHGDDFTVDQMRDGITRLHVQTAKTGRQVVISLRRTIDLRPAMTGGPQVERGGIQAGRWLVGEAGVMAGTLDDIRAAIRELAQVGVEHFICQFEHATVEEHVAQIELFAREVMPAIV